MKKSTVTAKEFEEKKKLAIETAPLRKVINTGEISVKGDKIYVEKSEVPFSNNGIKQLAETMGIPSAFIKKYSTIFGDEGTSKLISHIAAGLGSLNKNIMLIGSPVSMTITDVKSADHKYISAVSLMKLIEDTMNENPDLSISNFFVDKFGQIRLDTLNENKPFNFGRDEDFLAGLNFTQSPTTGTQLSQYMFRQICTNGSFGKSDVNIETGFDDDVVKGLYSRISKIAKDDFIPIGFGDRLKRAATTNASFHELKAVTDNIDKEIVDKFIPYKSIMYDLNTRRINPADLNTQQQKNCKLNCSVWDVVNALTDYASHDYGFKVSQMESHRIQLDASKVLFKKNFDTENLISR